VKIVNEYPPNYDKICEVFPTVKNQKGIIFTYGDTCYVPGKKGSISAHLKVHERTHVKQQGDDPESWWDKYLTDPKFRLSQEVEAYRRQYKYFCGVCHSFCDQKDFMNKIAGDLSSEIYGNLVTLDEAKELITKT